MRRHVSIALPGTLAGFDVKLAGGGGETWLAGALQTSQAEDEGAVTLFRVDGDRLMELSRFPLWAPLSPLFWRDSLLVFARIADHSGWEVRELGTGGGRLELRRIIHSGPNLLDSNHLIEWCVANDALVAWNLEYRKLTIYSMT